MEIHLPKFVELDSMGYPDIPFDPEVAQEAIVTVAPVRDYLSKIGEKYRTKARWNNAIVSLYLSGVLEGDCRDIEHIKAQLWQGIIEDEGEELAELVLAWANETIKKSAFDGLDEWYKAKLGKLDKAGIAA